MYQESSELERIPFLPAEETTSINPNDVPIDDKSNGTMGCPGPPAMKDTRNTANRATTEHLRNNKRHKHFNDWKPNMLQVFRHILCPVQKVFAMSRGLICCCAATQRGSSYRKGFSLILCCVIASLFVYLYQTYSFNSKSTVRQQLLPLPQKRQKDILIPHNFCPAYAKDVLETSIRNDEFHKNGPQTQAVRDKRRTINILKKGSKEIEIEVSQPQKYQTRSPARVLLICKTSYSLLCQLAMDILTAGRITYKMSVAGKNIPDLIKLTKGTGKYVAIVFEEFQSYLSMDRWNREILDKYCRSFDVGIVAFVAPPPLTPVNISSRRLKGIPLTDIHGNKTGRLSITLNIRTGLNAFSVNQSSSMLRIMKGGQPPVIEKTLGNSITFNIDAMKDDAKENYAAVAWAKDASNNNEIPEAIVLQDFGYHDGIQKVIFGIRRIPAKNSSNIAGGGPGKGGRKRKKGDIKRQSLHWTQHVLFLDSLWWLSKEKLNHPSLNRYMRIDVDDIFTGKNRLRVAEVEAMRESQQRISKMFKGLKGFKYNLGFSGDTFKKETDYNTDEDDKGDELLLTYRDEFSWFPHDWHHMQPHLFDNVSTLIHRMELNKKFAADHGMLVNSGYAVPPHHSGVFPVHEQLYEAWKIVWNITVTSTEEYPHLHPGRLRRGFIHAKSGIRVLPRQTCGLYTKNLYYKDYPIDPELLEWSIKGGELFQTFIYNPVSIFMTHMPNYAFDRLAPYTFESVLSMIKCWTNLELKTVPPGTLARIYFDNLFPEEKIAIWSNPCDDKRHREIWSESKSCKRLPDFLVIGPQKTGTTALYKFLQIHPSIKSNNNSSTTFEELQFFSNNKNYEKGIDWYMKYFPTRETVIESKENGGNADTRDEMTYNDDESMTLLFEKSATYFDREMVPERAYRLLKKARLIAIIISPATRAYSWYQHQRAKGDTTAMHYSFHEVITANGLTATKALKSLQSRCLEPGKYASHLERWLQFYHSQQLTIVDGEQLLEDPISVMNNLQHFLSVKPLIDYADHLIFDDKKGYFCQIVPRGRNKCLGKGKGRDYNHIIEPESLKLLQEYYRLPNEALLKLLNRLGYDIPQWLEDDLKDFTDIKENDM